MFTAVHESGCCAQELGWKRRIGVLMNLTSDDPESPVRVAAFAQGLERDLVRGWRPFG
jgi:hypothetical protein